MKFGDKLIALRKKNSLSQEQLAEKLKVSRQSVSKWESNNTYPETEKIIQICNIFNCSMDSLINENIKDINEVERKEKNNFNITLDSFLEFITKSIDMFSKMSFTSGLKCIIEFVVLSIILAVVGSIGISIVVAVLSKLINFIPDGPYYLIKNIIEGIVSLIWLVVAIIILVHTYKIRYLDYFKEEPKEEAKVNIESIPKINIKKDKEVIIRDSNTEPFAFLSVLSKIVILFIKFIVFWILFGFSISFVCLIAVTIILIPFSISSMCFIGIVLALIGCSVINFLVVLLLFNFIFERETNLKRLLITFLISLIIIGIGGGVGGLGFKNLNIISENNIKNADIFTKTIDYKDNMYIENTITNTNYIIDNSLSENKIEVSTKYNKDLNSIYFKGINHSYNMEGFGIEQIPKLNIKELYKRIIKDLKNNTIKNYDYSFDDISVRTNEETINKLIGNLDKLYLYDKENTDNGFIISNVTNRINLNYEECEVDYNALTGSLEINDSNCSCEKIERETSKGIEITYNCKDNK